MKPKIYMLILEITLFLSFNLSGIADEGHLEPMGLENKEENVLYDNLVLSTDGTIPLLWMIESPSLSSNVQAVVIDAKYEFGMNDDEIEVIKDVQCHVRCVSAISRYDLEQKCKTIRHETLIYDEVSVSESFATLISNAWVCVLKCTRYPTKETIYLDGIVYTFGSRFYCGRAVSPETGSSKALQELAFMLKELSTSDLKDKVLIQNKCEQLAESIIAVYGNKSEDTVYGNKSMSGVRSQDSRLIGESSL